MWTDVCENEAASQHGQLHKVICRPARDQLKSREADGFRVQESTAARANRPSAPFLGRQLDADNPDRALTLLEFLHDLADDFLRGAA